MKAIPWNRLTAGLCACAWIGAANLARANSSVSATYGAEASVINFSGMHHPDTTPILLGDTGALPVAGGFLEATQNSYDFDSGVLSLKSGFSGAFGGCDEAISGATVTKLQVQLLGSNGTLYTVTADSVSTLTMCVRGPAGVETIGQTFVTNLALNGQPIKVTGKTNQIVTFDIWTITINQQTAANDGDSGSITTAGLYITMPGCLEGYVVQSSASLTVATSILGGTGCLPSDWGCGRSSFGGEGFESCDNSFTSCGR